MITLVDMMTIAKVTLLSMLVSVGHAGSKTPTKSVDSILFKYYHVVGGLHNWTKIKSVKKTTSILYYTPDSLGSEPIKSYLTTKFKKPYYYYGISNYAEWISDGGVLYRKSQAAQLFDIDASIQEVSELTTKTIVRREFNFGITDTIINSTKKEYEGLGELEGQLYEIIRFETEYGWLINGYFDRETGLLKAYETIDNKLLFVIDSYKKFNKLLIPSRIRGFNNRRLEFEEEIKDFETDVEIPDEYFRKSTLSK